MNANTWIKVPGAPTYEVSTEAEPRVRNKRTGRVIAENRRTVDIYLKDRKKTETDKDVAPLLRVVGDRRAEG